MSALATGCLPWGVKDFGAWLPLCTGEYILCCGHKLKRREAQAFVDAGLLQSGTPDRMGRPTLVITRQGRNWLDSYWA